LAFSQLNRVASMNEIFRFDQEAAYDRMISGKGGAVPRRAEDQRLSSSSS
jgi:hypothetical protein